MAGSGRLVFSGCVGSGSLPELPPPNAGPAPFVPWEGGSSPWGSHVPQPSSPPSSRPVVRPLLSRWARKPLGLHQDLQNGLSKSLTCFLTSPWHLTSLQNTLFPSPVQILRILPGPAQALLPYMKWPLSILFLKQGHLFSSNQRCVSISLFSTAL